MQRILTSAFLLALVSACGIGENPGTQIGTESQLECVLISSDEVVDLTVVPEGFNVSAQDALSSAVGAFTGPPLDGSEQPLPGSVSLTVETSGGAVVLERYEVDSSGLSPGDASTDPAIACPPRFVVDLDFVLQADGLPDFEDTLATGISDQAWADTNTEEGFEVALPAPTSFDPNDFEQVEPRVVLSGGVGDSWSVYIDWLAWNPSEAAPDGDVTTLAESLLMARLEAL